MPPNERISGEITRHMASVLSDIQMRQICPFFRAEPAHRLGASGRWRSMTQKQPRILTYLNEDLD